MAGPGDATAKLHAPATARNRDAILDVLRQTLPTRGRVLEIGAGSGEHAVYFAAAFPGLTWQPTDVDPRSLASIAAWRAEANLDNLLPAIPFDARDVPWAFAPGSFDAILCVNVIHIAPWSVCLGLTAGAGESLTAGGALVLYGPFQLDGRHTAPSNAAFDRSLKAMDRAFGVRDLADVAAEAAAHGLRLERQVAMPANNFTVIFHRRS